MGTLRLNLYKETDLDIKAEKYGVDSLSDSELLAVLMDYENDTKAKEHLSLHRNIDGVVNEDSAMLQYKGVSAKESLKLNAIGELARRVYLQEQEENRIQVTSPEDVNAYMAPKLRHLTNEKFMVISLDNTKRIIKIDEISSGGKTATIVDTADVMRKAVINGACSIVLVHNHPSGHNKASTADIQLTKRIIECGQTFGIPVDDHVIIAGYNFVSLRSNGLM